MEQTTKPVYSAPVVLDAGDVAEVTLGTNSFDTADDFSVKSCVLELHVAARAPSTCDWALASVQAPEMHGAERCGGLE
ncbi:hypothetical protein BX264_5706 [Streptomyces sp. 2333.5]|uniref:lasso RiPP family leader peptide-containing protein n=1 Tax=unclassified Streptomyces TaxID=2593676 RepID=UPI000894BBF7|nr:MULTISPECIES: lasso RiPP family leader peptide-containing protein [unclassified Streptomyces]PJJ05250.1 hypothetical protein BX264_5706 [Streptomyces sp. 2333.5]SEE71607.1 hypothetical protein SAMN05428943_5807 [Streptomyces sp. 2314.4]SEE96549.1 hypothetical protein SAMN05428942_5804 [Streptomyces sp. 2112.2]